MCIMFLGDVGLSEGVSKSSLGDLRVLLNLFAEKEISVCHSCTVFYDLRVFCSKVSDKFYG